MNRTKNIALTVLAVLLYAGLVVGFGFIWNLFWKVDTTTSVIYWVSKGIIIATVALFALLMLLPKNDKGVSAIQLFFSLALTLLPLILRGLCMIPVAGKYIAIILGFLGYVMYFFLMLSLQGYSKGEGNKKI